MKIIAVKLRITTEEGDYGFVVPFSRHLTIIRGNNSAGKSTLFQSLLYGLGMEELVGGKNEKVLPYAVKDHFNYEGREISVIASEVLVEIENSKGKAVTFRRSIRDTARDTKLIDVIYGRAITSNPENYEVKPTYLHDKGGADKEIGFHGFLEEFLDMDLPRVPKTDGKETKLYLQAIFAALAVEQKRGWTDYIANIPFYGIRDARTRVVEYLLALDVFKTNAERARLNTESVEIAAAWDANYRALTSALSEIGVTLHGAPIRVTSLFEREKVKLIRGTEDRIVPLTEYVGTLLTRHAALVEGENKPAGTHTNNTQEQLAQATFDIARLTNMFESENATLSLHHASIQEYEELLKEASRDLSRNKTAQKLKLMGAEIGLQIANDHCPTCHQGVDDSLLMEVSPGPQMDLDANINYLDKQSKMLSRQISGARKAITDSEMKLTEVARQLNKFRTISSALRRDLVANDGQSRAAVREQIQIEVELEKIRAVESDAELFLTKLEVSAKMLLKNQAARKGLPASYYSEEDLRKIGVFEQQFRANAGTFEYESAPIRKIRINEDALVPFLSNTELRDIKLTPMELKERQEKNPDTDIKSDSSASDFVRLILSYLLALYQASSFPRGGGRHPGILLLDEPGQHSMGQSSQRALLKELVANTGLQAIVAASFDESPEVFKTVTADIEFKLIELKEKSIRPLKDFDVSFD